MLVCWVLVGGRLVLVSFVVGSAVVSVAIDSVVPA